MDCATSAGITTLFAARDVDAEVDTIERRGVCNAGNADSVSTYLGGGAGEVRPEESAEGEFVGALSTGEACGVDVVERNCTPVGGMGGVAALDGGGVAEVGVSAARMGFVVATDCPRTDCPGTE